MEGFRNRTKKKHVCHICKRITCISDKRKSKEEIAITPSKIRMDMNIAWDLAKAWLRLSNIWRVVENTFGILSFACSVAVVFIADKNNLTSLIIILSSLSATFALAQFACAPSLYTQYYRAAFEDLNAVLLSHTDETGAFVGNTDDWKEVTNAISRGESLIGHSYGISWKNNT